MLLSTYLVILCLGQQKLDEINVRPGTGGLELAWTDAEDRLQGTLSQLVPRAGEPLKVSVRVGTFQGPNFEGPITFTLRRGGDLGGETLTVQKGELGWSATLHPRDDGEHSLDVSFRTTRLKVLHAPLVVATAALPGALKWAALGLIAAAVIAVGVRSLRRTGTASD